MKRRLCRWSAAGTENVLAGRLVSRLQAAPVHELGLEGRHQLLVSGCTLGVINVVGNIRHGPSAPASQTSRKEGESSPRAHGYRDFGPPSTEALADQLDQAQSKPERLVVFVVVGRVGGERDGAQSEAGGRAADDCFGILDR
jgi:hypothetical protein